MKIVRHGRKRSHQSSPALGRWSPPLRPVTGRLGTTRCNPVQPGATWCNREQAQKTCEDAPLSSPERAAEFSASPDCKSPTDHQQITNASPICSTDFDRFWASVKTPTTFQQLDQLQESKTCVQLLCLGFAPE